MKKKLTIGVMGSNQIKHLIPVLEMRYNVINLQPIIDSKKSKLAKTIDFAKQIRNIDVLYNVFSSQYFWKKMYVAKALRKKVITHWIGTDVRYAMEGITDMKKYHRADSNMVCFKPLQEDLASLGLHAEILPITPFNLNFDLCKMPEKHSVIIYMPQGVEKDYGWEEISQVFPKYPTLEFKIVANNDKEKFALYPNVKVLGYLSKEEMEKLYNEVSIVLRIHISDGLSMSVLEGMAKGKKIIWNCEYPYCYPGSTTEEICNSLDILLKDAPKPDQVAHDFIVNEYTREKFLEIFESEISR